MAFRWRRLSHLLRKKLSQSRLVRFKNEKLRSQGIQADNKEPNPIASADTNATYVATANVYSGGADVPVLTSSASIEAECSTEMYDVEDGVHLAAAKQLASSGVKNLTLFHYHPS
jgi:hypothetical protein